MRDGIDAVNALRGTSQGAVTLALVGALASTTLTERLRDFRDTHPAIDLRIQTGLSAEVSALVPRGDATLGLRAACGLSTTEIIPIDSLTAQHSPRCSPRGPNGHSFNPPRMASSATAVTRSSRASCRIAASFSLRNPAARSGARAGAVVLARHLPHPGRRCRSPAVGGPGSGGVRSRKLGPALLGLVVSVRDGRAGLLSAGAVTAHRIGESAPSWPVNSYRGSWCADPSAVAGREHRSANPHRGRKWVAG